MYATSVHNQKIYEKYNAFFLDEIFNYNINNNLPKQIKNIFKKYIQKYLNLTQQCLIPVIG